MKKLIWVLAAAALILALLLGFPLLSRLVYGRSQQATLFAWQLKKEAYSTEEAFAAYLSEKSEENALEYGLPAEAEFSVPMVQNLHEDMRYYVLNGVGPADQPVIFYYPGGSYIDQPRAVHWRFLDRLAADTGAMIVVPIYPKLPDCGAEAAYAALTAFYTDFMAGMLHGETVFMGDSAGGGMALSFAMQLRDAGLQGPDKLILICPWLDVALTNPDIPAFEKKDPALDAEQLRHLGVLWAGGLDTADPVVSPLYESFDGLGRITLLTGTAELLYPDIMALDARLTEQDIDHETCVMKGMFHVWPLYIGYGIPETEEAFDLILEFIKK